MPDDKKLPWGINAPKPGSAKQESEEAAKVYAEFVASFEKDDSAGKTFVKGETIVPKLLFDHEAISKKETSSIAKEPELYKPQPLVFAPKSSPQESKGKLNEDDSVGKEEETKEERASKKRNLDAFLEEIKREQEEREDRLRQKHTRLAGAGVNSEEGGSDDYVTGSLTVKAAFEYRPGSHDTGDPHTTNLYVGNISPELNEEMLCKEFAKYGPIASVKIMWPRTQEEKDRNRNCGFVSFMDRESAAQALKNMDGKELLGYVMRVGWGKAVPIPPKPVYAGVLAVLNEEGRPPPSGLPFNAQMVHTKQGFNTVPPPGSSSHVVKGPRLEVQITRPDDPLILKIIHRMVERVVKYGPPFEAIIMDREWNNSKFRFLFQNDSLEHIYYRWKLYSILQGDPKNKWRTEPFHMFDEGPIWVPPEIPFEEEGDDDVDSDEEDERERERIPKGTLGPKAKNRLESMLRKLIFQRGSIAQAMAFAIDHSDAATEIVDIICKTLMIRETPIPTKVARLYLVSDILHNSSVPVPNAWKFRAGFETRLPEIFEHLNEIYRSISGRLKAETFRRQIITVLTVWENWIVFPQPYIESLTNTFMKNTKEGDVSATSSNSDELNSMDLDAGNGGERAHGVLQMRRLNPKSRPIKMGQ
ncbi:6030_t:CDS:10 [Paraglomus occultum]|uniref:6030_t:CDS:1 n=1 Tax=Paraglomus occultum TaxID=144539 RepID=A0A9N9GES8_9GLOM|nr:6030_t:CDS:10 [Paraglomus occultum]